jgi:hypothetical protein
MKIQLCGRTKWALVVGAVALSGCNSPSSSPPTQPDAQATAASSTPAPASDNAVAPQRKPPAGMGNAIGRVLYNGKGAAGIEVELCQDIGIVNACSGKSYQGKTDKQGFYVIDNVKPGEYALAVRVFNTNKIIYPSAGVISAKKFKIEKDQSFSVQTVNLWKTDLQIVSPKNGSTVKTGKPTLTWKSYPGASNYKVELRAKEGMGSFQTMETSSNSATPEKPLLNGAYQWRVEASNAEGTKIAETDEDATFKVTGQAGSSVVDLVAPKPGATVGGAGLTLQWKANPIAQEYHVYLKGTKAKDPILKFDSVNGTSYKLPNAVPPDQYFWSVEAYRDGEKVASSELKSFTVK